MVKEFNGLRSTINNEKKKINNKGKNIFHAFIFV